MHSPTVRELSSASAAGGAHALGVSSIARPRPLLLQRATSPPRKTYHRARCGTTCIRRLVASAAGCNCAAFTVASLSRSAALTVQSPSHGRLPARLRCGRAAGGCLGAPSQAAAHWQRRPALRRLRARPACRRVGRLTCVASLARRRQQPPSDAPTATALRSAAAARGDLALLESSAVLFCCWLRLFAAAASGPGLLRLRCCCVAVPPRQRLVTTFVGPTRELSSRRRRRGERARRGGLRAAQAAACGGSRGTRGPLRPLTEAGRGPVEAKSSAHAA
jgi:hypothetical protein